MAKFNIWLEIEEVDEEGDEVEIHDAMKLAEFDTLQEALEYFNERI